MTTLKTFLWFGGELDDALDFYTATRDALHQRRGPIETGSRPAGAKKTPAKGVLVFVGPVGLEPTTHGLKVRCSTN